MREKVFFKTFGCRTNVVDSQIMMSKLKDFETTLNENEADVIVINSCTVTNSADSTARGYINGLKKSSKNPRIIFTGCGVWTKGETLFKENKIDALFGASEKENINQLLLNQDRFFEAGDLNHIDNTIIENMIGKSRAFIKIQEGCDFRCSYCIIPYVRGNSRSYSEEKILEQVKLLASNGFGEFILTGTNLGSFGKGLDGKDGLALLLQKISQIKGVRRIRLGSVEPIQITEQFKELLDEPWMAKHLHIALQHTTKEMLNLMNRRNKLKSDLELFEYIAGKGYALGTDFIVGHPGESEAIWKEAMENVTKFPLTHLHGFTYSKRDGTPSATMTGQVNGDVAKKRLSELSSIIDEKNYKFRKNTTTLEVLIEQKKDNIYLGYDQFFNQIEVTSKADLVGDWIQLNQYTIDKEINRAIFE
ncbi:MAG: tRNA (N(6)-L-threonylcarbamoyladenosine(37)-C(2))-methylthiotransferase MtaB [Arcobacteraceae bacterium]|nr:tRNA (N(6)-L-threonylcarbamoyladenosine(37)-C(2))-methylthiotransferase MtaB [Arcobacteraceae bacterium]